MAKLEGLLKAVGSLQGYTIVKTQDGYIIKKKSSMNAERIKRDPAFKAIRQHQKEFGACAKAAKLLRDILLPVLEGCLDNRVSPRLNKVMNSIKNLDTASAAGKRSVAKGLAAGGAVMLKGFNFNVKTSLGQVLLKPPVYDKKKGELRFAGLKPTRDLRYPKGTTHVVLHCGLAGIDFSSKTGELREDSVVLPLSTATANVVLRPKGKGPVKGLKVLVLRTGFLQELNGIQHVLSNASYNAAAVVAVWG